MHKPQSLKIAILIPTYNEVKNVDPLLFSINKAVNNLHDISFSIYVIDDSSPDGTASAVLKCRDNLTSRNLHVKILTRKKKEGLGKAYIYGFNIVRKLPDPPHYILQMDSDLSHDPLYINDFLKAATKGADLIVGSRYMAGGSSPDWSWYRKAISRGGNFFARAMLSKELTDYTGGFNMYSLELLNKINFDLINTSGYGFQIELKFCALQNTKTFAEIPIVFADRKFGVSKMPLSTIFRNFLLVLKIRLNKK